MAALRPGGQFQPHVGRPWKPADRRAGQRHNRPIALPQPRLASLQQDGAHILGLVQPGKTQRPGLKRGTKRLGPDGGFKAAQLIRLTEGHHFPESENPFPQNVIYEAGLSINI
jgi:hypothetical protein